MVRRVLLAFLCMAWCLGLAAAAQGGDIQLPEPRLDGEISVERALAGRRSIRSYANEPLTLEHVGQVLWSAQGLTSTWGGRTAPSAGALYPLEMLAVIGDVIGIPAGVYRYHPAGHRLSLHLEGDWRAAIALAALGQLWMADAPVMFVVVADFEATAYRYGDRAERYVHMETGHVCQNIYLQAGALGLGTVVVGAFIDETVQSRLAIDDDPVAIMPVGHVMDE